MALSKSSSETLQNLCCYHPEHAKDMNFNSKIRVLFGRMLTKLDILELGTEAFIAFALHILKT